MTAVYPAEKLLKYHVSVIQAMQFGKTISLQYNIQFKVVLSYA